MNRLWSKSFPLQQISRLFFGKNLEAANLIKDIIIFWRMGVEYVLYSLKCQDNYFYRSII